MGVYTTAELNKRGIGKHRIRTLIRKGQLFRLHRGLYTDALTPINVAQAVTRHFAPAVLTGRTAAQLHLNLDLTLPITAEGPRHVQAATFTITRSRLPSRTVIHDLPVVEALWAARATPQHAQQILERHYSGTDGHQRLTADLARMQRVPAVLRRTIDLTPIAACSELERLVARPLLARGYRVELNRPIGPYCFDILLPKWHIAIEIDSAAFHHNGSSFISDRWKSNSGAAHGWIVLRFTDSCVEYQHEAVLAEIEQAIAWVRAGRRHRDCSPGFPSAARVWEWNPLVSG